MARDPDHRVASPAPTATVCGPRNWRRSGPFGRWADLPASRKLIGGGSLFAVLGLIGYACPGDVGRPMAGRHLETVRINAEKSHPDRASHARNPAGPASGNVLLEMSGTGHRQSATFVVPGPWDLGYTYDCSNFPDRTGDFFVTVHDGDGSVSTGDPGVDESGPGRDAVAYGRWAGAYYVSVDTECHWAVKVRAK
jgi:hypothetical protein